MCAGTTGIGVNIIITTQNILMHKRRNEMLRRVAITRLMGISVAKERLSSKNNKLLPPAPEYLIIFRKLIKNYAG
jgi:hypothetical protein